MISQSEEYVTLKALSVELGLDRSNMRKYVMNSGIEPDRRRTPDSGSQLTLTVSPDQADFIRRKRQQEGYGSGTPATVSDSGLFYVVQLVPELDPRRLKLGFTDNLTNRLSQHRTAAPTAIVLKSWQCKRSWEVTITDALTVKTCRLIQNEVFECESLDDLLSLADELFMILPDPKEVIELSEYSPMNGSASRTAP